MESFTDKTAVVTGGASGIGRALAHAFAASRARVVIADVEADALERRFGAILDASGAAR